MPYEPILRRVLSAGFDKKRNMYLFVVDFKGVDGGEYCNQPYTVRLDDLSDGFAPQLMQAAKNMGVTEIDIVDEEQKRFDALHSEEAAIRASANALESSAFLTENADMQPTMTLYKLQHAFIVGANIFDFDAWVDKALSAIESPSGRAMAKLHYKRLKLEDEIEPDMPWFQSPCLAAAGMSDSNFHKLWALGLKVEG